MRALVCLVPIVVLTAALSAEDAATKIARLIQQLGSDRFVEREAASRALEAMGPSALEALEAAARDSSDPEIRARAQLAILAIRTWTYRPLRTLEGHTECVCTVAFAPDGRHAASAGWDMVIW